jgi:hypothetical protein
VDNPVGGGLKRKEGYWQSWGHNGDSWGWGSFPWLLLTNLSPTWGDEFCLWHPLPEPSFPGLSPPQTVPCHLEHSVPSPGTAPPLCPARRVPALPRDGGQRAFRPQLQPPPA